MTEISTDTEALVRQVEQAHAFANALRSVADVIDDGDLPLPTTSVRVYCTSYGVEAREAFLSARRTFPAAPVTLEEHYVAIDVGSGARLLFDKNALGTRTTVTREVVEYVVDPALLAAVPA